MPVKSLNCSCVNLFFSLCVLTISDNLITREETTSEERQSAFNDMMVVALETAIKL